MAEAVVAIVAEGLKPLGDFIIQQANILSGVSSQVELARTELQFMYGFLKDADAKQEDNEVVRIWVANIRDAAYDLEDVIETFVLKVALKRRAGSKKIVLKRYACIFKEGCHLYRIGSDIEQITNKISKLRLNLQSYNIKEIRGSEGVSSPTSSQDRRLTFPHVMERDVVGIQDNIETLAKNLVEDEKCHRVLSIWGMGGSGKTTLAKHVYHHNEVRRHFDCFAWVCISQRCQGRDVLEEILVKLKSATKVQREEIEKLKTDEIAEQLCIMQQESKCLVVVDDIWTLEAWNSSKAGFPMKEETHSRVLLTTRNKEVAMHASGNNFLYQPQPLSKTESWELFEKITISGRHKSHNTDPETYAKKEESGKKMLQHCAGLPLAITVLAGVLARKVTVEEWDLVRENVDVYIRKGTVLERGNKGQEYEGTAWVLALSYDNLPYRLKLCFLYLCQFPEDYEIPVKRLTQLWIAEGLIPLPSTEMMEDVAYNCLNELVERCMVQVGKLGSTNKIKTCRLHDLIRDLCVLKAKEENFLSVIHLSQAIASMEAPIGKVRRLAIYLDKEVDQLAPTRDGQLRSLLYFVDPEYYFQNRSARLLHPILEDFKFLRVLKFEDIGGDVELPSTIGNLIHLRFLSLKNSNIKRLPSSVANLVFLQTLDLRCFDWDFLKMQNVFGKMEHLRHLYLPGRHRVSEKLSLASLRNLQTLVNISSEDFDLNDLAELTSLRKLIISAPGSTPLKFLEEILESGSITFKHLLSLSVEVDSGSGVLPTNIVLRCPNLYKLRLHGRITELPKHICCYPNLTKMTLQGTGLREDQTELLAKLPNLRILYLGFYAFQSETIVFTEGGFPHLEFLSLDWWWQLKEWRVEKGSMPSLCRLHIEDCSALRELPDGLQYVSTLKEITINFMYREFCTRAGEGGEDFYKIKHVPSLIITNITFTEESEMLESTTLMEMDGTAAGPSCQIRTKQETELEMESLAVSEVVDPVRVAEQPTMDNAPGEIVEIQVAC